MKSIVTSLLIFTVALPASAATFKPISTIGNVQGKQPTKSSVATPEITISSNPRAASATALSYWAGIKQPDSFISKFGIQGSGARWQLRPGRYEILWQFETVETDGDDSFLIWDGVRTNAIASSNLATIRSGSKLVSYWQRTKVITKSGDLALVAIDTRDKFRTSSIKVYEMRRVLEPNAITGIFIGVVLAGKLLKRIEVDHG